MEMKNTLPNLARVNAKAYAHVRELFLHVPEYVGDGLPSMQDQRDQGQGCVDLQEATFLCETLGRVLGPTKKVHSRRQTVSVWRMLGQTGRQLRYFHQPGPQDARGLRGTCQG